MLTKAPACFRRKKILIIILQVIPAACCILDTSQLPLISPLDDHCVFVPTKYNSYWTEGCGEKLTKLLLPHTKTLIWILILILASEFILILLCIGLWFSFHIKNRKTSTTTHP